MKKNREERLGKFRVITPRGVCHSGMTDLAEAKKKAGEMAGSRVYERGAGMVYTYCPAIQEPLLIKFLRKLVKLREGFILALGR